MKVYFNLKKSFIFKAYNSSVGGLGTPINLSVMWNFGSLLGIFFGLQILSGMMLATQYLFSDSVYEGVIKGESSKIFLRYLHANGASFIFFFLYFHVGRGLYYSSFMKIHTWNIGVTIFFFMMGVAFMGYVLPGNQMSFWGASVITGLVSEIPYLGKEILQLLWGGYGVEEPFYLRLFSFHYLLPFVISGLIIIHIILLHTDGSSNPLGQKGLDLLVFHKNYSWIDIMYMVFMLIISIFFVLSSISAWDYDVFAKASDKITPHHIQPEWYFLFAYAILRSIPNKLGGVIALVMSIVILYFISMMFYSKSINMNFYSINKNLYWFFLFTVLILTWIGFSPAEPPFTEVSRLFMVYYFSYFLILNSFMKLNDYLML